jgi:hypothetical protein
MTDEIPQPQRNNPKKFDRADLIPWVYAMILVIVFVALLQLYFSIQQAIALWFSTEYIPILQSAFFIVVIAVGLYIVFFRKRP